MSTATFESNDSLRATRPLKPVVRATFKRLLKALPRTGGKPEWAHVTNRAWRRNSALLTYMHESHADRH